MSKINELNDMTTYVRAVVSDAEKEDVKRVCAELGLAESQIIRAGLKKMGVEIEIEKAPGVSTGNFFGTSGVHPKHKDVEEQRDAIRADYQNGMTWKWLEKKYGFSTRTLGKVLEDLIAAKKGNKD